MPTEVATARIINDDNYLGSPRIIVVYGEEKSEIIPLAKLGSFERPNYKEELDQILIKNEKTINKFYQDMNDKGYIIEAVESVRDLDLYIIFRKLKTTK